MFDSSSIFVMEDCGRNSISVKRIEIEVESRINIVNTFKEYCLFLDKESVEFDGMYKPLEDECLFINDFKIPIEITEAINNPLGVEAFKPIQNNIPNIRAIFVADIDGDDYNIAFQRFRRDQYIASSKHNLFFDKNTFLEDTRPGISISKNVDCFYNKNKLLFNSYYYANQVFNLSEYYRTATNDEIRAFGKLKNIYVSDIDNLINNSNQWLRKKIASINDSKVLEDFSVDIIKGYAISIGIDIDTEGEKIIIPENREEQKALLSFLDGEAYEGPFSKETFLTNSKRKLE